MQMKGIPLAPKKSRWPKSEQKQAVRRYQLTAAAEYKRSLKKRLYGSQGAASPVRRIDPVTGEVIRDKKR